MLTKRQRKELEYVVQHRDDGAMLPRSPGMCRTLSLMGLVWYPDDGEAVLPTYVGCKLILGNVNYTHDGRLIQSEPAPPECIGRIHRCPSLDD